jgi:hypothetical protein
MTGTYHHTQLLLPEKRVSNLIPNLHIQSIQDYRCEPPHPAVKLFILAKISHILKLKSSGGNPYIIFFITQKSCHSKHEKFKPFSEIPSYNEYNFFYLYVIHISRQQIKAHNYCMITTTFSMSSQTLVSKPSK